MTAATPPDLRWISDLGIESGKIFKFPLTPPLSNSGARRRTQNRRITNEISYLNQTFSRVGFGTGRSGGDCEREDSVFYLLPAPKILRTVYFSLSNHPPLSSYISAVKGLSVFPLQRHISSSFERAESVSDTGELLDTSAAKRRTLLLIGERHEARG
jgi:hypothetical protein